MTSMVMKFDTLAWTKKLEKAGIPSEHAEAQVEMLAEVIEDNICTKQDLSEAKSEVKKEIVELKKDILIEIERIKGSINTQIAKWVLGVSALQAAVLIALIRSLH
jgi:glycerol-3-phosphate cytidylyltransferase-like family protein